MTADLIACTDCCKCHIECARPTDPAEDLLWSYVLALKSRQWRAKVRTDATLLLRVCAGRWHHMSEHPPGRARSVLADVPCGVSLLCGSLARDSLGHGAMIVVDSSV